MGDIFALFSGLDFWGYLVPGFFMLIGCYTLTSLGNCEIPQFGILFENAGNIFVTILISYLIGLFLQAFRRFIPFSNYCKNVKQQFTIIKTDANSFNEKKDEDFGIFEKEEEECVHESSRKLFELFFGSNNSIFTGNASIDLRTAKSYSFVLMSQECPTAYADAYRLANVCSLMKSIKQASKFLGYCSLIVAIVTILRTWEQPFGWEYGFTCLCIFVLLMWVGARIDQCSRWFSRHRSRQMLRWMCQYMGKVEDAKENINR